MTNGKEVYEFVNEKDFRLLVAKRDAENLRIHNLCGNLVLRDTDREKSFYKFGPDWELIEIHSKFGCHDLTLATPNYLCNIGDKFKITTFIDGKINVKETNDSTDL